MCKAGPTRVVCGYNRLLTCWAFNALDEPVYFEPITSYHVLLGGAELTHVSSHIPDGSLPELNPRGHEVDFVRRAVGVPR